MRAPPPMPAVAALAHARRSRIARLLDAAADLRGALEMGAAPLADLLLRLWVAQAFWISGVLKVADWDNALLLATHEYPVAWMDPRTAAVLGAAIELVCPVFLALGFATRFAVLPMLALALVIQLEYRALNEHLYWMLLLGLWLARGAGGLSLDRWLAQGADDSALPLAGMLGRLFGALQRHLAPLVQPALRLSAAALIAAATLAAAGAASLPSLLDPAPLAGVLAAHTWVEQDGAGALASTAALGPVAAALLLASAALVASGLGARIAALAAALVLVLHAAGVPLSDLQRTELGYLLALLALVVLHGAGPLSADAALGRALRRRYPEAGALSPAALAALPHVVIVGAGFGGMAAARALRHAACRVTLVDQRNYHLFQPLLYQVATAGLSPADIATPVRELFRDQPNLAVRMARVTGADPARRELLLGERRLAWDFLVLATGARHSYFGKDAWEPHAPGLKQVEDATAVRRRLLLAFERAEDADDAAERARQLTFVIIGGGPTGVELAGAIAELARHGLRGEFRRADPAAARVVLVQSGPRVLPAFSEPSSAATLRSLSALGVEVVLGQRVEQVDGGGVTVGGSRIPAATVFWAAGVQASEAADWLGAGRDNAGRIKVGADLSVPGHAEIFAIGDTAASDAWDGKPVPGLAPAAKQGGAYVADLIRRRLEGRAPPPPFRYRHLGSLATIGRKSAVADFGRLRLSGPLAWWFWGAVHVLFLAGMRNRIAVAIEWFWAYLTFRRSTRLITGPSPG